MTLEAITGLPVYRQLQRAAEEIAEDKLDRLRLLMRRIDEEFDRQAPAEKRRAS